MDSRTDLPSPPHVRAVGPEGLPIFRFDAADRAVFYVPTNHPARVLSTSDGDALESALAAPDSAHNAVAKELLTRARRLAEEESRRQRAPYQPTCLTLLPTNACNMACPYCHTRANERPTRTLALPTVAAAAPVVAANCGAQRLPLTVVLHGGGEPSLDPAWVEAALTLAREAASRANVPLFAHIATNGVMPEATARRLARHIDSLGLSCDGPEDIQSLQRPALDGSPTLPVLAQTARLFREANRAVTVRVTVTEHSVERMPEMVEHFRDLFSPARIVFEPLYLRGRALVGGALSPAGGTESPAYHTALCPPSPKAFVANLLRAWRVGRARGIAVEFPDCVPQELHGGFCHVFRDVFALTADGHVTACFDATEDSGSAAAPFFIGACDEASRQLRILPDRVAALRRALSFRHDDCRSCFNRSHCARGCPEICPLRGAASPSGSRRCETARLWAYHLILETCGGGG